MAVWDNDDTELLISLYQSEPCLWNPQDPNYKNTRYRAAKLDDISFHLNSKYTGNQMKERFRNIKTVFQKEQKKVDMSRMDNDSTSVYRSKWAFFDRLQFLSGTMPSASLDSCFYPKLRPKIPVNNNIPIQKAPDDQPTPSSSSTNSSVRKRRAAVVPTATTDNGEKKTFLSLVENALIPCGTTADRFDKFGEYVAESIRLMGSKADLAILDIQQVLVLHKMSSASQPIQIVSSSTSRPSSLPNP